MTGVSRALSLPLSSLLTHSTTRVRGSMGNFRRFASGSARLDQLTVAREALLDIQVMARSADFFLHTASAVAEAVIYTNPNLHCRSTHLEYEHNATLDAPWLEAVVKARRAAGHCIEFGSEKPQG